MENPTVAQSTPLTDDEYEDLINRMFSLPREALTSLLKREIPPDIARRLKTVLDPDSAKPRKRKAPSGNHPEEQEPLMFTFGNHRDVLLFLWVCKHNPYASKLPMELKKEIASFLYYKRLPIKGDMVDVRDTVSKWYPCLILDTKQDYVLVHYYGWPDRYNEWIPLTSPRIAPLFEHDYIYGKLGSQHPTQPCTSCATMKPICGEKTFFM